LGRLGNGGKMKRCVINLYKLRDICPELVSENCPRGGFCTRPDCGAYNDSNCMGPDLALCKDYVKGKHLKFLLECIEEKDLVEPE
jgi:hypothetical protein